MIFLYDLMLKEHIKSVYDNTFLTERTKLYKRVREEIKSYEPIKLPVIGLYRSENSLLNNDNHAQMKGKQQIHSITDSELSVRAVGSLKIGLKYQVDILAKTQEDADTILSELLIYLVDYPEVSMNLFGITLSFRQNVEDLSLSTDYGSFDDSGEVYSHTITINIDEARILYFNKRGSELVKLIPLSLLENTDLYKVNK